MGGGNILVYMKQSEVMRQAQAEIATENAQIQQERRSDRSEPKLSRRVKAKLGATMLEMRDFIRGNNNYYEEESASSELKRVKDILDSKDKYPEYFDMWQIECLEDIRGEKNVILSSPTGSGKTDVFMEWAKIKQQEAKETGRHNTTYITAPIKALSNQRFRALKNKGYNVGIETGDIKNVPEDVDIVCCTQEIYANKYAEQEDATLIVDEFHYIFENQDRSRAYIDGIHKSKAENMLLCSGTFGSMEKLDNYIEKVTSRDFRAYENHERLTGLEYGGYIAPENIKDAIVVAFSAKSCEDIASSLRYNRADVDDIDDDKKSQVQAVCDKYGVSNEFDVGVATYYGRMLPKEKLCVEELFEKRLIDTVVGTDALALGVNFPVDKVVFAQLAKYHDGPISKNLFDQLSGRAGRKGFFDNGIVYFCDDFSVEAYGYSTEELFDELICAVPEDVHVEIQPDIKRILLGDATIEEEASYVLKFSTNEIGGEEEIKYDIEELITKIKDFKVSDRAPMSDAEWDRLSELHDELYNNFYADEKVWFDIRTYNSGTYTLVGTNESNRRRYSFEKEEQTGKYKLIRWGDYELSDDEKLEIEDLANYGYRKVDERKQLIKNEIAVIKNKRVEGLSYLDREFQENIAKVYDNNMTVYENEKFFAGILLGFGDATWNLLSDDSDVGAQDWDGYDCFDLNTLLQYRRRIMSLPARYRKEFDIAAIDRSINNLDETVLNSGRGALSVAEIQENIKEEK